MAATAETVRELTRDFFETYPDYFLCRTMAENVVQGVKSRAEALNDLAQKARASQQNAVQINEMLDRRTISIERAKVRIKDLTLTEIMELEDAQLGDVVEFYCKHPFAHGRTRRSRFLPRWLRTLFLGTLLGHAKRRGLELDYEAHFDLVTLL